VLHLVLRRAAGEPILALLTARPGELGHSTQAAILRESLGRLGGQEVALAPLDEGESLELLQALIQPDDTKPSGTVQRSLVNASGGFPMVLELLVQEWRAHGSRSVALALDAMTAEFVVGADPSAAYGQLLSRLVRTLEPAAKSVLDLASVLGHRLNDLPMYSVIDLSLGQTMAALGQLSEIRVLRDGTKGLEFANELIRAHAYAGVPSSVRKALHDSVADRLRNTGDTVSRLEIAWHTMRAGRVTDAIPHLLEGARAAVRHGAPQSAEMALASAVPSLQGHDFIEATLLLTEALQEQGRWRDSLDYCEGLTGMIDAGRSEEATALAALAKCYLGSSISEELLGLLPTLKHIMKTCPHVLSRVRAARAAAHGISLFRNRNLALELLSLLDEIPTEDLDIDAKAQVRLARALFLYQAGAIDASFVEATQGLEELRRCGAANSVAVQFQLGLGVTSSLMGRYDEAATYYERGTRMASLLGNDSAIHRIAGNLALAYVRLGKFEDQLKCAEQTPRLFESGFADWSDIQLAYAVALAHGVNGRVTKMREVISDLEARLPPHISATIRQRWLLWKADVLLIAGLKDEALDTGTRAVRGYDMKLESNGFAGVFARWTAMTSLGDAYESVAEKVLTELEHRVEEFDAIDQLEILCANAYFHPGSSARYADRIAEKARRLPPATAMLLRRLGMGAYV
jgi:tetratricopeptide (TPR) repeat protein